VKTPADKTIAFTFYSLPTTRRGQGWKARVVFAPGSCDGSSADVEVVGADGRPVDAATFVIAGQSLPVCRGRATLPCAAFAAGRHETGIWLHREGENPVPGALTFE
jgi:hypothetical protein